MTTDKVLQDIFHEEYAPQLNWNNLDRLQKLLSKTWDRLEETRGEAAKQRFIDVSRDFMNTQQSVDDTQAALKDLLSGDAVVSAPYASFLDAPLGTEEERESARKKLCDIFGLEMTMQAPPNYREIENRMWNVVSVADKAWGDGEPEKLQKFTGLYIGNPGRTMDESREDLEAVAQSDECVMAALTEYFDELHRHDV